MNTQRGISLALLISWMLLSHGVATAESQPLKPYTAEYSLLMGRIVVGKIDVSLDITAEGAYTYRAHTITVGIAALFRKDEITEISQGTINGNRITPLTYFYHRVKRKKVRKVSLDFDWKNHKVSNRTENSDWSMDIPSGAQDKFSQQLALMSHLTKNDQSIQFKVADGGRLKTYLFERHDRVQLQVEAGSYDAVKLTHAKDDRPSRATFWMAPDLHYLPIKIVKQEKDGEFTVELRSVSWNRPKKSPAT
ncbi:MAG: DUF3108 domain-containing protein [Sedimenticola sp.]